VSDSAGGKFRFARARRVTASHGGGIVTALNSYRGYASAAEMARAVLGGAGMYAPFGFWIRGRSLKVVLTDPPRPERLAGILD
jgi:hypothetical protein